MNNFLNQLRYKLQRFMQGRYGGDQLTRFQLLSGLVIYLLSIIFRVGLLAYASFAMYAWAVFRMFSRNRVARMKENQRYLELTSKTRQKPKQYRLRFENRKEYKYFMCPKCHTTLRMRRGSGQRTVTCAKCGHQFEKKA